MAQAIFVTSCALETELCFRVGMKIIPVEPISIFWIKIIFSVTSAIRQIETIFALRQITFQAPLECLHKLMGIHEQEN